MNLQKEIEKVFLGFDLAAIVNKIDLIPVLRAGVRRLYELIPGDSPVDKADTVAKALLAAYEEIDNLPGLLGFLTDSPFVDQIQAEQVEWIRKNVILPAIQWAYVEEATDSKSPVTSDSYEKAFAR